MIYSSLEILCADVATEVLSDTFTKKNISSMSVIAFGSFQIFFGIPLFPFQLCGRVFSSRQPFFLLQGVRSVQKARSVSKGVFGVLNVIFGAFVIPFQLCGRVFNSKDPFLIQLGLKNTLSGIKGITKRGRVIQKSSSRKRSR